MTEKRSSLTMSDLGQDDALSHLERLQSELDQLKVGLESEPYRTVRGVIRARRERDAIFGDELFADPAWDILLELYAATLLEKRIATSEVCGAAAVPQTTALRWLDKLDRLGWLERHADPEDGRRVFVDLTAKGAAAMERYFEEVGPETAGA